MGWRDYLPKENDDPVPEQPGDTDDRDLPAWGEREQGCEEESNPVRTLLVCYWCWGTDFWHSLHGLSICRRCHPPAPGVEIAVANAQI